MVAFLFVKKKKSIIYPIPNNTVYTLPVYNQKHMEDYVSCERLIMKLK